MSINIFCRKQSSNRYSDWHKKDGTLTFLRKWLNHFSTPVSRECMTRGDKQRLQEERKWQDVVAKSNAMPSRSDQIAVMKHLRKWGYANSWASVYYTSWRHLKHWEQTERQYCDILNNYLYGECIIPYKVPYTHRVGA